MSRYSLANTKKFVLFVLIVTLISIGTAFAGKPKITVFGSSVAYGNSAKDNKGYWFSLKEVMESRGWEVSNCSRGGDRTSRILDRFDDLLSHKPDYVFIGLSLANEGIREKKNDEEREAIYIQYKWGMKGIIALLRSQGIEPVVGLCYPHSYYTPIEIDYVRRMNLLINTWDVPSANFLGAVDDTSGGWAVGYYADPYHPNTKGHAEMFYTIVPSLFDAMKAGKPIPAKVTGDGYTTLGNIKGELWTVYFDPMDTIHSHSTAFWFRTNLQNEHMGLAGAGSIELFDGRLRFDAVNIASLQSNAYVADGKWHHMVVSHRYAKGDTQLYVDGELAGSIPQRIEPKRFTLGGMAGKQDFKDWMVFRAALNEMEVKALYEGKLLQASLEIYAPLQDKKLQNNKPVENRAQSMSEAIYTNKFTRNL
ncbi:MAG: hypothetical protein JW912_01175 [Sedimentisphaerales bacterium]|nr:hypothetical protein [Sedimentisphaerales bacterium]